MLWCQSVIIRSFLINCCWVSRTLTTTTKVLQAKPWLKQVPWNVEYHDLQVHNLHHCRQETYKTFWSYTRMQWSAYRVNEWPLSLQLVFPLLLFPLHFNLSHSPLPDPRLQFIVCFLCDFPCFIKGAGCEHQVFPSQLLSVLFLCTSTPLSSSGSLCSTENKAVLKRVGFFNNILALWKKCCSRSPLLESLISG